MTASRFARPKDNITLLHPEAEQEEENLPPIPTDTPEDIPEIDEVALVRNSTKKGYPKREAEERIYKNDVSKEATVPLSIRPPLSVANRFIAYCKKNRLSYWEGLNELMTKAKI